MKNSKYLGQGLLVAAGLFLANAVLFPALGLRTVGSGLRRGAIAAGLAMVIYFVIALVRPARRHPD